MVQPRSRYTAQYINTRDTLECLNMHLDPLTNVSTHTHIHTYTHLSTLTDTHTHTLHGRVDIKHVRDEENLGGESNG